MHEQQILKKIHRAQLHLHFILFSEMVGFSGAYGRSAAANWLARLVLVQIHQDIQPVLRTH